MNKYQIVYAKSFKKDSKKIQHDKKLRVEMENIIDRLANDEQLEEKYHDHALIGNMRGYRECHIRNDVLLIYKKEIDILIMACVRIGSHSNTLNI